jgi:DNA replication initiation complex subunit (GINS family)
MDKEDINYKTLRRVQELERNSQLLTSIDAQFYQSLSEYITMLEKTVKNEKNPQKVKLFHDEIHHTKKLASSIYELREKKIVQAALSKVRGGKPDLKHLLDVEQKLYEALVTTIESSRKNIFKQKEEQNSNKGKKIEQNKEREKNSNTSPIVRVLEDLPDFVGTDMKTYSLKKEDVLTLEKEMSEPLLKRGVIQQIK